MQRFVPALAAFLLTIVMTSFVLADDTSEAIAVLRVCSRDRRTPPRPAKPSIDFQATARRR